MRAALMCRASWNRVSSPQCGFNLLSSRAIRLCCLWRYFWFSLSLFIIITITIREGLKKCFLGGKFSQMWVGGFPNKVQTPKKKQITPKIAFLTRISHLVFPNLTRTLGWVGRFTDLGKLSKKKVLFLGASLEGVVKKRSFYGQADRKCGGGSAPSALTVSKCENFGPIFPIMKW